MLLKCIKTEATKLRHSYLWLVFLAVPVLPTMMGTGNYKMNLGLLTEGWYSLWTQQSLFYASFFYGPLIALYCSYTWRIEHLNYNWNHLMTMPVPERDIFGGKLILAMGCTVGLQLWIWILYILAGKLSGLPGLPELPIFFWLLRGSLGGLAVTALQLVLSMMIRSFAVPIALALLGSVAGMLLSSGGYGLFWPYSLMTMGMNANDSSDRLSNLGGFLLSTALFFLLFTVLGIVRLKRQDVCAAP